MQKFIALWQHRFKKYNHLLVVYFRFFEVYLQISFLKFTKKKEVVAIILTQQFGDIVASEPLSRQIRQLHPKAHIIWIVKPIFSELLENNPSINQIVEEYCANQRRLLLNSGIFDTVYNLQFRNNSHCEICDKYVENPTADAKDITIHNYYFRGNLLEVQQKMAGLPILDETPRLFITQIDRNRVDSLGLPPNYVVVHCQSAQNSRNWDKEKWTIFIENLIKNTTYFVVEIGLSSELNIQSDKYINLCGQLSLLETAEIIRRAKLFVGIDSGPAHLANAVGTFGVIMIGKLANFVNHIPYSGLYKSGENAIIIRNTEGPSSEISVEKVIQSIADKKLL